MSPRDFVRNRILNFSLVVLFIANFLKGSMQDELDNLFKAIFKWDVGQRVVTRSALSQARRKISHRAFIELLDAICAFVNRNAPLLTYCDMRVFAIDGSTARLPDEREVIEEFGCVSAKGSKKAMGRISLLHDVLNRITYDAILKPYSSGERDMAWEHLDEAELPPGSLLLLDRGYGGFPLLRNIFDKDHHFCVRLKSNLKIVRTFQQSNKPEMWITYKPDRKTYRQAAPDSPFREGFPVRLVRYRIANVDYFLMTTLLDSGTHSRRDLIELYHQRWQVEESYKVKKCRMKIEDISGITPEIIRQDFHAKVFGECLTTAMMLELRDEVDAYCLTTRDEYRVSITQALANMKNTIVLMFIRPRPSKLISHLLKILMKSLVAMVPGRKYKRKNSGKNSPKLQTQSRAYRYNR